MHFLRTLAALVAFAAVPEYVLCSPEAPSVVPEQNSNQYTTNWTLPGILDDQFHPQFPPTPVAIPYPDPFPDRPLLLAIELCRHGDRAPIYEYPNDILPASKWPEGAGELTAVGQRAHFDLGTQLRRRYVDTGFLKPSFNTADLYLRSTTIDRTLMSAYSQMSGMFPAGTAEVSDVRTRFGGDVLTSAEAGLPTRWQPVPIHAESIHIDKLLLPGHNCPRMPRILAEKATSEVWGSKLEEAQPLLHKLATMTGSSEPLTMHDISRINDIWVVYESHMVPLPDAVTPTIRKQVRDIANWMLVYGNSGIETRRLRSGLLLNEIKQRMTLSAGRARGTLAAERVGDVKKFVLYSAHDSTVSAAMSALGVEYAVNPPYNSTLIWELRRDAKTDKMYVTVEYNGKLQRIPGCTPPQSNDTSCSFADYLRATRAVTVKSSAQHARECMVGLRRQTAGFMALFSSDPPDSLESSVDELERLDGPVRSVAIILLFIVVLVLAGKAVYNYIRGRYVKYALMMSDDDFADRREPEPLFERRRESGILL